MKHARYHVVICLSNHSWGRVDVGVRIALDLRSRGDRVEFVVGESGGCLARAAGFKVHTVEARYPGSNALDIYDALRRLQPASVIHCDFINNANILARAGVAAATYLEFDCPVIGVDIWDRRTTGLDADIFGNELQSLVDSHATTTLGALQRLRCTIVPVPICKPGSRNAFQNLPPSPSPRPDRLSSWIGRRMVLFCTSEWQHHLGQDQRASAIFRLLQQIIAQNCSRVSGKVHLVHIGPRPLEGISSLSREGRYHWLGQVSPRRFVRLLASTDVMLSANPIASTVVTAIAAGVPIIMLESGTQPATLDEAMDTMGRCLSPVVRRHVPGSAHVYGFHIWPLGCRNFIRPLLDDNPFCETYESVELLDEEAGLDCLHRLLFDNDARDQMLHSQNSYLQSVRQLPSAADAVYSHIGYESK